MCLFFSIFCNRHRGGIRPNKTCLTPLDMCTYPKSGTSSICLSSLIVLFWFYCMFRSSMQCSCQWPNIHFFRNQLKPASWCGIFLIFSTQWRRFGYFLLFVRVDDSLTHSLFPFPTLYKCLLAHLLLLSKTTLFISSQIEKYQYIYACFSNHNH